MKNFEYYKPTSLKEALDLLKTHEGKVSLLNGGTDLIVRMQEGHSAPPVVVDIKRIPGLNEIQITDEKVTIGATVLLNTIGVNPVIRERYPFLAQAALSVGSKQVRNRATLAGNICNASPLADTATPLMVLEADVHVYGEDGTKIIPINEFFVFVRKTVLKPTDIVTGISFKQNPNLFGIFTKMSRRKEVDLSTVCATVLKTEDTYRISCGAVAPTPVRLPKTEAFLAGKPLSDKVIDEACEIASGEVTPISDIRASEAYRREMVGVMLKRSLTEWI